MRYVYIKRGHLKYYLRGAGPEDAPIVVLSNPKIWSCPQVLISAGSTITLSGLTKIRRDCYFSVIPTRATHVVVIPPAIAAVRREGGFICSLSSLPDYPWPFSELILRSHGYGNLSRRVKRFGCNRHGIFAVGSRDNIQKAFLNFGIPRIHLEQSRRSGVAAPGG